MPPPSLSSSTMVSGRPSRRRGQQAADVVRERDVADQQHDRPARGRGDAEGGRDRAVDPVRAAVGRARGAASRAPGRTSRRRAPASRRRRRASPRAAGRTPSSAATRGSHSPAGPSAAAIAPAAARSARRPRRASHSRSRGRRGSRSASAASVARGSAAASVADRAGRVLPRVLGIEGDLQRALVQAVQPLAQRLGRRQVADAQDEVGPVRLGPGGVAQQRVVVGDRRRAAPRARERVGEQRDPRRGRRRRRARRRARGRAPPGPRRARPAGAPRAPRRARRPAPAPARAVRRGRVTHGRPPARPPPPGSSSGQRRVEHERLAQREVEVHGPGPAVERRPVRAAGELAQPAHRARAWRARRRPRGTTSRRSP